MLTHYIEYFINLYWKTVKNTMLVKTLQIKWECLNFTLLSWVLLLQKYDDVTQVGISLACPGIWKYVQLGQNRLKEGWSRISRESVNFCLDKDTYFYLKIRSYFFLTFYLRIFILKWGFSFFKATVLLLRGYISNYVSAYFENVHNFVESSSLLYYWSFIFKMSQVWESNTISFSLCSSSILYHI